MKTVLFALGTVMRHKKDLEERIAQGLSVSSLDETPGRRGSVSSTTSRPESLPDTSEDEPTDTVTMVTRSVTTTTQGVAMETTANPTTPTIKVIEATPDRETPTPGNSIYHVNISSEDFSFL